MDYRTDSVSRYWDNFWQHIVDGLPKLLGALLVLLIAWMVAKAVSSAVHKLLETANLNQRVQAGAGGNVLQRAIPDPSSLIAKIVYWVIFFFGLSLAVSVLGIGVLADFIRAIYGYLPNVLAAFLIFLVASAVSAAVVKLVTNTMGDTATGKIVASASPVVVMAVATFMILNQLKIAPEIVTITYALILGSVALGMALAFGLGGRDVAGRMLEDLYAKGRANKGRVAADFKHGANEARGKADAMRRRHS